MCCFSASPIISRLKKTLKLEPAVEPAQKLNVNGHVAKVGYSVVFVAVLT